MTVKPNVFLGSSSEAREYAEAVQSLLFDADAEVTAWWSDEAFPAGKTFIEALVDITARTNASLLLATTDDEATRRGDSKFQPRDNVILEHGLFVGAHGRGRAAIATLGKPDLPTDLLGIVVVELSRTERMSQFKEKNRGPIRKWVAQLQQPSSDLVSAALTTLPERDTLLAFMDEMDKIWQKFDAGWGRIHRQDYVAERNVANSLDEFFQHYQGIFAALLKTPDQVQSVSELCTRATDKAYESLEDAWEHIAEGKMRLADEMSKEPEYRGQLKPYTAIYDKAAAHLQEGKRARSRENRLRELEDAVDTADEYMKKAQ
jgi:hypothetical protein